MPKDGKVGVSTKNVDARAVRNLKVAAAKNGMSLTEAVRKLIENWSHLSERDSVEAQKLLG